MSSTGGAGGPGEGAGSPDSDGRGSERSSPLVAQVKVNRRKGEPCNMPTLWKEDPRLADVQDYLMEQMTTLRDWRDLFDLDRPEVLNRCFQVSAEANLKHSDEVNIWQPIPDIMKAMADTVERMGDEVFATWVEAGDREAGDWTFRQTWEAAGAVAYTLVKEWGVKPGDRVILCYNFSFEYFPAFLGCLRAGAIACPVYPIDPSKMEIALTKFKHVVEDTGARVVLTDKLINRVRIGCSMFYSHLMPKDVEWRVTDHLVQQKGGWLSSNKGKSFDYEGRKPSDVAFLQYTSGSTGDPKGVMITFANLGANVGLISGAQQHAFNYGHLFPLTYENEDQLWFSRSRSVSWLPMYHDMGLVYGVVTPFYMGARMHYMSPITFLKDPCSWIRLLAKHKATWAAGPDFAYRLCAKKWDAEKWPKSEYSLTYMIYMHTGAEPIRKATMDDFNKVFHPYHLHPRALSPCYGLAESVVCVSWYDPVSNPPDKLYSAGDKPGYVCVAADFRVDLRIVDPESCEEVEDGQSGELWVSGPSVAQGYWNRPEISEKTFRATISKGKERPWAKYGNGKYLRTGDMAFMVDGRVYYSGRIKDMIIVRGQNFYAQDIEFPAQDAWAAIRGGCIAAFSSDVEGIEEEQLEVVFELAPGKYSKEELDGNFAKVAAAIKRKTGLDTYRMVAVKDRTIPKTTSGKIRRKATKEALQLGTLWVLHDSLGLLRPGKGRGYNPLASPSTPNSNGSGGRPELERSQSSSYLAGIGESIGGILGSLYDAIADPLGAYTGLDAEVVAGPLPGSGRGGGNGARVIEEVDEEGEGPDGVPRPIQHSQSYLDKYPHAANDWSTIDLNPPGSSKQSHFQQAAQPGMHTPSSRSRGANNGGLGAGSAYSIGTPPPSSWEAREGKDLAPNGAIPDSFGTGGYPLSHGGHGGSSFALSSQALAATAAADAVGAGVSPVAPPQQQQQSASEPAAAAAGAAHTAIAVAEGGAFMGKEELAKLSRRHREAALVEMIVQVCRGVGVEKEGISGETDMINLGLSSVKAAQMIGEIEGKFGVQGSLSEVILYECATIQDVAQLINRTFFAAGDASDGSTSFGARALGGLRLAASVAGQLLACAYAGGLVAAAALLPLQLCAKLLLFNPAAGSAAARLVAALLVLPPAYLLAVFLLMAFTAVTKWAVIGRYKEGVYPVKGLYYQRWLLVDNLLRFTGRNFAAPLRGTRVYTLWLQSMGMRGAAGSGLGLGDAARIHTDCVSEFDLLTVGPGAVVGEGAKLRGAVVEGEHLILKPVSIGARARVGAQALVLPGAVVGEGAVLKPATVVSGRTPAVEAYTLWEGSPAKFVERVTTSAASSSGTAAAAAEPTAAERIAAPVAKAVDGAMAGFVVPCAAMVGAGICLVLASLPAMALMGALILATGGAAVGSLGEMDQYGWALFIAPLIACFGPLALPFYAVLGGTSGMASLAGTEGGKDFLDIARAIATRYYVVGAGVAAGVCFVVFGAGVVVAAAVVQRLAAAVLLWLGEGRGVNANAAALPVVVGDDDGEGSSSSGKMVARWVVQFRDLLQEHLHARFPVLLGGSKGYALYLRALGADVHHAAYVASEAAAVKSPERLVVGEGAFVHPTASLLTASSGSGSSSGASSKTVVGAGSIVASMAVVAPGATVEAEATLAPLSQVGGGQRVLAGTSKCGYTTLLRLQHPYESVGASAKPARWAFAAFTWLYPLVATAAAVAALYCASYPAFLLVQLALAGSGAGVRGGAWLSGLLMGALFPVFGLAVLASAVVVKLLVVQAYVPAAGLPLGQCLAYYQHLFVTAYLKLADRTFGCLVRGTPLYNLYLRALGMGVGAEAIVLTGDLEATDLLAVGDQTVVGRDAQLSGVKLAPSTKAATPLLQFAPVTVGHECTLGDGTVAMASADVKDLSIAACGTLLTPEIMLGRRVMVEGNLPYRTQRSSSTPGNLVTPSGPFNAPMELVAPDLDLKHDCAFFAHLANAAPAPPSYRGGVALVTGANGFVGRHLVQELLDRGVAVYCLVRGRPNQPCHERMLSALGGAHRAFKTPDHERRLRVVDGDVSKPKLGLRPEVYDALAAEVTIVFHCATILGFAAPYANLRAANVVGTKRALEFAAHRRVKRFNHVSSILATSMDMANPKGMVTEVAPLGDATRFPIIGASEWTHGYGLSKWCQEVLVQQAQQAGLPVTVCRLGEVGPHSRTGFMEEGVLVDLFHDTIRSGLVPHALGTINVTPVDYCARGILSVGLAEWGLGRTYHLLDPRFECSSGTVTALLQDLGYPIRGTDFLTWRRRMKQDDIRKSWFIAGVLSGEQQLVGQNFDATDGGALLVRQEQEPGIDGALLLRRFAMHAKLRNDKAAAAAAVAVGYGGGKA